MLWLLAQADTTEKASRLLLYSCIVVVAALIVGWIVIVIAKKRADEYRQSAKPMLPFTLHDLREMHAAGQLSDEEFAKAREKIVAMSKAALAKKEAKQPGGDLKARLQGPVADNPAAGAGPTTSADSIGADDTPASDDLGDQKG